jgi:hypothetical protein
VRDREVVERFRIERERLRRRVDQLDVVAEATMCHRQHLGAQVEAGHPGSPPQELRRDQPRPGRHVEHVTAERKARDEEAAPKRLLSQRERGADAVVGRPERGEQLAGLCFQAAHGRTVNFHLVSLASRPSADIGGITDAVPSRPVLAASRPC